MQDQFVAADEAGKRQDLDYDFKGVWKHDGDFGEVRAGSSITFGQYDFTGAMPDSLVIISIHENEDGLTACGVNIYQLDENTWRLAGVLKALDVLGACEIQFKVNKVTIPRHLRGFYHQLTFQNGRFEDTSDF